MNSNKKIVLGIVILVSFILFVLIGIQVFAPIPESQLEFIHVNEQGICPYEQKVEILTQVIPLLVSIALLVGAGTYYLMTGKVETKQKALKSNIEVLLQFLDKDEQTLVNKLIEGKGQALQAEVSRLPGMTRLKSHRVILKLMDKGVIEKQELGKTNIIKFKKELKEGLIE
ncbi:MAG: hypothetical protein Q7S92_01525 [Candidatus Diapherotrites archaeon]|nr:hypothetical protein [Candidatus Diapherotrites archaeon]